MEKFITRKQNMEEEASLYRFMLSIEHRKEIKEKIIKYLQQVDKELLELLR